MDREFTLPPSPREQPIDVSFEKKADPNMHLLMLANYGNLEGTSIRARAFSTLQNVRSHIY